MDESRESLVSRDGVPDTASDPDSSILLRPMKRGPDHHLSSGNTSYISINQSAEGKAHGTTTGYDHGLPDDTRGKTSLSGVQYHFGEASESFARRPHFLLNWWQESTACIVSVLALLALWLTVQRYDGRPSPDWPNWLSLNTIVAIYTVLLKTGILLVTAEGLGQLKWSWFSVDRPLLDLVNYDDASRGPFGALTLLWRLKLSHLLASLAASITVLALAIDPVTQQILHYKDCDITMPGTLASIPRTNYYYQQGGLHTGALQQSITPGVQSAINAGIFNPGSPPAASCSTGNCTWDSHYSSLGWCSACDEVSHLLSIKNHTYLDTKTNETFTNLTTSLPDGGLVVSMAIPQGSEQYAAMGPTPSTYYSSDGVSAPIQGIDFVLAKNIMGEMDPSTGEPFPDCGSAATNNTWKCRGYGASRCRMYPCVKTYSAQVNVGSLHETVIGTGSDWGSNSSYLTLSTLDTTCINADQHTALVGLGYNFQDNQSWLPYNITFDLSATDLNNTFPQSMAIEQCIYGVDITFIMSMNEWLAEYLSGVVLGPIVASEMPLGSFSGPQPVQTLFNFGDVTFERTQQFFENITTSFTNYIRQNGVDGLSKAATGRTLQDKTCIAVRWRWMTFPVALVALTLVFFTFMALETRPTGPRPDIWKSSPLALLYHGLSREDGSMVKVPPQVDLDHIPGMKTLAKTMAVRLNSSPDNVVRLEVRDHL